MNLIASRLFPLALLAACLALTSACGRQKAHSLKEAQIPAGFTFKTSQSVAVTVDASKVALPAGGSPLEVARADGKVLFRGRITAERPLHLKLALATKERELTATLRNASGTRTLTLPISGAVASASFH